MDDLKSYGSFADVLEHYESFDVNAYFDKVTKEEVEISLSKEHLNQFDFLNLLSPKASSYLEQMAEISKRHKIR